MNNLVLNKSKTKEIIFHNVRSHPLLPPPIDGIIRVDSIKILGVTLQDNLSMNSHVDSLLVDCSNMLCAMKILRSHGMNDEGLHEVFEVKDAYRRSRMPLQHGGGLPVKLSSIELIHFWDDPSSLATIQPMVQCLRNCVVLQMIDSLQKLKIINFTFYITVYLVKKIYWVQHA